MRRGADNAGLLAVAPAIALMVCPMTSGCAMIPPFTLAPHGPKAKRHAEEEALRHRAAHYALKASATALGFSAATFSKARAGPSGVLRPCSQFFSVATLTPIIRANAACDFPSFRRIDLMSAGLNVKTRLGFALPRRIRPAWRTLLLRS